MLFGARKKHGPKYHLNLLFWQVQLSIHLDIRLYFCFDFDEVLFELSVISIAEKVPFVNTIYHNLTTILVLFCLVDYVLIVTSDSKAQEQNKEYESRQYNAQLFNR